MERYTRHVLVCTGGFCSPDRRGRALYAKLAELLEREGLLFGPTRVKRSETPCLGVCAAGPILAVYPEGIWYAGVTPALLNALLLNTSETEKWSPRPSFTVWPKDSTSERCHRGMWCESGG